MHRARAGSTTAYSFGDHPGQLGDYAWYGNNGGEQTHPVGQKKPNSWGLYDMYGNVWRMVQDWYGAYRADTVTDPSGGPPSDWAPGDPGRWRVGPAPPGDCRSAGSQLRGTGDRLDFLGFRLLRTAE